MHISTVQDRSRPRAQETPTTQSCKAKFPNQTAILLLDAAAEAPSDSTPGPAIQVGTCTCSGYEVLQQSYSRKALGKSCFGAGDLNTLLE
jgi:hypothetical protein